MVALALALTACAGHRGLTTGSIPNASSNESVTAMNLAELGAAAESVGAAYEKAPEDKTLGMAYAEILRMTGRHDQALAVMQQVAIDHPEDQGVLAAYGKAQAAAGDLGPALDTIRRAQTPARPDWRLLSAEGAILDQMERPAEARALYQKALQIEPNEPSVLSNLGMSHLLEGNLAEAETYMKKAVAQPGADSRVRQNLALVIGLQGRFDEAERIAAGELPAEEAAANVAYLRSMIAQQQSWAALSEEKPATN
jgi:Flp pilus assembly protein TadD